MPACIKRLAATLRRRLASHVHSTGCDLVTLIERKEAIVAAYADAFIELARNEGLPEPNRKKLMYKLRQMSPGEIERVYDACSRFGVLNLVS